MNNQNNTILLQYTVVLSQLVSSTYDTVLAGFFHLQVSSYLCRGVCGGTFS